MDLLLIPVTRVLDPVLNHAREYVGSDSPGNKEKTYINTFIYVKYLQRTSVDLSYINDNMDIQI